MSNGNNSEVVSVQDDGDFLIFTKNYLEFDPASYGFKSGMMGLTRVEPILSDVDKWKELEKEAFPSMLDPETSGFMDAKDSFPSMLDPASSGFMGVKIPDSYASMMDPAETGLMGLGDILGYNPIGLGEDAQFYKTQFDKCSKERDQHRAAYQKLAADGPQKSGMTQAEWAKRAQYHATEYNRLKPQCEEYYKKWKAGGDEGTTTTPLAPGEFPAWTPYKFTAFPKFSNMDKVLAKIKTPPAFFKSTIAAIQKGPSFPAFDISRFKLATPKFGVPGVDTIKNIAISVKDMGADITGLKNWLTSSKILQVTNAQKAFRADVNYIKANIPDPTKTIVTNGPKAVRMLKRMPMAMEDMYNWLNSYYSLTVGSLKKIRDFAGNVYSTFTDLPSKINAGLKQAYDRIKKAVNDVISQATAWGTKYAKNVSIYVEAVISYTKNYLTALAKNINAWVKNIMKFLQLELEQMLNWIKSRVGDLGVAIKTDIGSMKGWFETNLNGLWKNIQGNVGNMGKYLSLQAQNQIAAFQGKINAVRADIMKKFDASLIAAKKDLQVFVTGIESNFEKKIEYLSGQFDILKGNITSATDQVKALTDKVIKTTELVEALSNKLSLEEGRVTQLKETYDGRFTELEKNLRTVKMSIDAGAKKKEGGWLTQIFGG